MGFGVGRGKKEILLELFNIHLFLGKKLSTLKF